MLKLTSCALVIFLTLPSMARADNFLESYRDQLLKDRKAQVVDTSGTTLALTKVEFEADGRYDFRFDRTYGSCFYVINTPLELCLPMNSIILIAFDGENTTVKYTFLGKTQTATGKWLPGHFSGQLELGDFTLAPSKVKQITFTEPPIALKSIPMTATIILQDGTRVAARDLVAIDLFEQQDQDTFYSNVYHTYTYVSPSSLIHCTIGEAILEIAFGKVKNLDFLGDGQTLSVTLKSGSVTKAHYLGHDEKAKDTIDGISGNSEAGGFFIATENIKSIQFK